MRTGRHHSTRGGFGALAASLAVVALVTIGASPASADIGDYVEKSVVTLEFDDVGACFRVFASLEQDTERVEGRTWTVAYWDLGAVTIDCVDRIGMAFRIVGRNEIAIRYSLWKWNGSEYTNCAQTDWEYNANGTANLFRHGHTLGCGDGTYKLGIQGAIYYDGRWQYGVNNGNVYTPSIWLEFSP